MDLSILYILSSKDNYIRYSKFIKKHLVTKEVYTIFLDLKEWYKSHDDLDWKSFSTWFKLIRHASLDPDVLDIYDKMFSELLTFEPTSKDLEVVHALIARQYADRIANFTGDIADGVAGDLSKVEGMMRSYNSEIGRAATVKEKFVTDDMDEIMSSVIKKGGYEWRLKELNLILGPLDRGDFITVGARPDSGKTTLLASEISYIATQLPEGKKVFFFCNEEIGTRVKARTIQSYHGVTDVELAKHSRKYKDEYDKGTHECIQFVFDESMHVNDVEEVLHEFGEEVGLIVFDQLHNMLGYEHIESEVNRFHALFRWARTLSASFPVINVHQLKGEAEGRLHPTMDMLYGSTTMVQGACDAIIMLGRSHDPTYSENTRGLSAPKNKLPGDLKTGGKYKNTKFEIEIQPHVGRFTGGMT